MGQTFMEEQGSMSMAFVMSLTSLLSNPSLAHALLGILETLVNSYVPGVHRETL